MSPPSLLRRPPAWLVLLMLSVALGVALRILPGSSFDKVGPDERFYALYVGMLDETGLGGYAELFSGYIQFQSDPANPLILPPGRITFISAAWVIHRITGLPDHAAITAVSCAGSVLLLLVCALFAWRTRGGPFAAAVTAILATAPLELHLAHLALIDSFFAAWATLALWALWEVFRNPGHRGWLALYVGASVAMVLTKENAAFVILAFGGVVVANVFLKFGGNTRSVWIATALGPLLGGVLLVAFAGGPEAVVETYRLNAARSVVSPYVMLTGDGPWHRYLIELLTLSPLLFLLFVGGVARLGTGGKAGVFLLIFFALTYLPMTMVCMNLRYATIWSLPMIWFAVLAIECICRALPPRATVPVTVGTVTLVMVSQLLIYHTVFVADDVYDPTPQAVQKSLSILKDRS